jgi:hypothetical protein
MLLKGNLIEIKIGSDIDIVLFLCYYVAMKITAHKSSIRTIRKDHPNFFIHSGLYLAPRAGFEINDHCPKEYRMIISECINREWLKPVAYMQEKELMISGLIKD